MIAEAVALLEPGRPVIAARAGNGSRLIAFDNTGSPDSGFGTEGQVLLGDVLPWGIAVQSDGRIVVAGSTESGATRVARLLPGGTPDPSFGSDGDATIASLRPVCPRGSNDVAIGPDGAIMLVGSTESPHGDGDLAVAKLTNGGDLDASFADGGLLQLNVVASPRSSDCATSAAIDTAGNAFVSGHFYFDEAGQPVQNGSALLALSPEGDVLSQGLLLGNSQDGGHLGASDVILDAGEPVMASAFALPGEGQTTTLNGGPPDFAELATFSFPLSLGDPHCVTLHHARPQALAQLPTGELVVVGSTGYSIAIGVSEGTDHGQLELLDLAGGSNDVGWAAHARDVAVDDDGAIYTAGWSGFPGKEIVSSFVLRYYVAPGEPPDATPEDPRCADSGDPPGDPPNQAPGDTVSPRTKVRGPSGRTHQRRPRFRFWANNDPRAEFFCRIDRRDWHPCRSPHRINSPGGLRPGPHRFQVYGVDPAGNTGRPAARRFRVIRK